MNINTKVLSDLLKFLKKNHRHNRALQLLALKSSILPFGKPKDRLRSLLVDAANTQARPNLDKLERLWSAIAKENESTFSSAENFCKFLELNFKSKKPIKGAPLGLLDRLFYSLEAVPGLGKKTAALFIKNLIYLHHKNPTIGYPKEKLGFWKDSSLQCFNSDKIYVPVDSVITHIFKNTGRSTFDQINHDLHEFRKDERKPLLDMLYWDDLWYWGFFNQHGGGKSRKTKINKGKFMTWKNSSDKTFNSIIKSAEEFRSICSDLKKFPPRGNQARG